MNPRWLYYQVHGVKPKRKPPQRATSSRGPARSWKYRAWIRTLACVCCGSSYDIEAAHTGSDGGMRQKPSDYSCIPLCSDCHTQAPHAHHRNREKCESLIVAKQNMTVPAIVKALNREWRLGVEESA